eukprot:354065-Chlamydomonas_euryale.AAC.2
MDMRWRLSAQHVHAQRIFPSKTSYCLRRTAEGFPYSQERLPSICGALASKYTSLVCHNDTVGPGTFKCRQQLQRGGQADL